MKKVFSVLCCMGIFFSSIAFTISLCGKSFVSDALVEAAKSEIKLEDQLHEVIVSSLGEVEESTSNQVQKISKEISEDKKVKEEMENFISLAIKDIVSNETKGDNGRYSNALKSKVLTYADELSALTNGRITEEELKQQLNENLSESATNEYYKDVMELTQMDVTQEQRDAFSLLNTLQGSPLFYGSLGLMILLTVIIIVVNRERLKFLIPVGIAYIMAALSTFILAGLFTLLMNSILAEIQSTQNVTVSNSMIFISGFVYSIIGGVAFTTRAITYKKQNH